MYALLLLACKPAPTVPGETDTDPPATPDTTCEDYWAIQALDEVTYSGTPDTCVVGEADTAGLDNALEVINYVRRLAGKEPYARGAGLSATAQVAAELMHANNRLSHDPTADWTCWTQEAADTAAQSLLATTPAVEAVQLYMVDFGNPSSLVHRRWLLSDWIDTVGIGSTNGFNAIDLGEAYVAGAGWTAWPPPGKMPIPLMKYNPSTTVDTEGWTIQSDDLDLAGAEVTVTGPDGPLEVVVSDLTANNGSVQAIKIVPDGWSSRQGTYRVQVPELAIDYAVEFVRCPDPS